MKSHGLDVVGTWRSPPDPQDTIDGELGPTQIRMELHESGRIEFRVSVVGGPGGAGAIESEGTYEVRGDVFTSDAIERGRPAGIAMEGGRLILELENGERYVFAREK